MQSLKTVAGIVIAAALVLGYFSVFTVDETEEALKFRLGEIQRADYEPGLHFKMPFVNNVRTFDARVQTLDSDPERYLTGELKNVIVDAFVKWRIEDVREYYTTVGGDPMRANSRLNENIKDSLRSEFGRRTIQEVVSGERGQIMQILSEQANNYAAGLGIEVLDVRIKRVDLPENVSESVFQRMVAERERVARDIRASGDEAAERIRADADRQRTVILAEARRDAEELRGEGEAEATQIFARAAQQDREFFDFWRSLRAYDEAFRSQDDVLVLTPESQFFRYLENPNAGEN
ncbi:protease modulator HflC [Aquisalimonas lutea]|uniref:protease modulator HflC n=1 Tax=Aquisalimonas lutea TaxID=1327750 RepID=UPI0025B31691|nr:protease modulator HflC [Aquisalimonas lutea]MDN3519301.1 protease modulator HflC [Aquisalimonas lutea]